MKKVMLAANEQPDIDNLDYPVLASGKIDGVRICVQNGRCVAGRSLKPSINQFVIDQLSDPVFEGFDGELTLADERWNDFNANQSAIMTRSGVPASLTFHVFDELSANALKLRAVTRKDYAEDHVNALDGVVLMLGIQLKFCPQHLVHNPAELRALYEDYRSKGYEGLIVMDPNATYKHGRSTLKQGIMLKLKPAEDDEAELVGFEPVQHNLDAGNSKCKANLVEGDRAGKLIARWKGREILVGPGKMTHALAADVMKNFDKYKGKLFTFTFMELHASGEPRSARFKGFRSKDDL